MTTDLGGAGGETILGCPISVFTSFESVCSITNVPACATVSAPVYDAACCGSISSYGESLISCFEANAPTCLDTSAIQASLTAGGPEATATNPCAAYINGGGAGDGGGSAPSTTAAPAAPSSAAGGSSAGGSSGGETTPAPTTAAAGGSTAAGGSASPSATASKSGSQRQHAVGTGLKVYIGVALVGALAVLSL